MARAVGLFEKVADGPCAPACSTLGKVLLLGQGVPKDEAKGWQWMAQGCELQETWPRAARRGCARRRGRRRRGRAPLF